MFIYFINLGQPLERKSSILCVSVCSLQLSFLSSLSLFFFCFVFLIFYYCYDIFIFDNSKVIYFPLSLYYFYISLSYHVSLSYFLLSHYNNHYHLVTFGMTNSTHFYYTKVMKDLFSKQKEVNKLCSS